MSLATERGDVGFRILRDIDEVAEMEHAVMFPLSAIVVGGTVFDSLKVGLDVITCYLPCCAWLFDDFGSFPCSHEEFRRLLERDEWMCFGVSFRLESLAETLFCAREFHYCVE